MTNSKSIHFIGIGGIGLSALARYYLALNSRAGGSNWSISGSDSAKSLITDSLVKEGVNVKIGHKKGNLTAGTGLIVYNRAIPDENPEISAAKLLGIPAIPYAKLLGEITRQYKTIAITGSHGKSTTTALAGLVLLKAGFDPTILVGTNLKELGGKNIRVGKSDYLVLEADDYGAAFLDYSPAISIVTNIDREHMDFYKNFTNVQKAFLKFMAQTRERGTLILNRDDTTLWLLKAQIAAVAKTKKLKVVWYTTRNRKTKNPHRTHSREYDLVRFVLKIPGEHNVSNAMAVLELGKLLKIPRKKILTAIGNYRGAWRRFEYRGESRIQNPESRIQVYDDYAHHPTEIRATLRGFREKFPGSPLICVFQPHQAKRLKLLFNDFRDAFGEADILILLPSYTVAGRDLVDQRHTSEKLSQAIKQKYPQKEVHYLPNPKKLKPFLKKTTMSHVPYLMSPVIVMMGAGDIVNYTDLLLK